MRSTGRFSSAEERRGSRPLDCVPHRAFAGRERSRGDFRSEPPVNDMLRPERRSSDHYRIRDLATGEQLVDPGWRPIEVCGETGTPKASGRGHRSRMRAACLACVCGHWVLLWAIESDSIVAGGCRARKAKGPFTALVCDISCRFYRDSLGRGNFLRARATFTSLIMRPVTPGNFFSFSAARISAIRLGGILFAQSYPLRSEAISHTGPASRAPGSACLTRPAMASSF